MVSYEGIHPIKKVAPPINKSVTMNVYLRPIKSPNLPKNNAPNGLTTKPAANVANVLKNAAVGLSCGKNLVDITVAKLPKI
jgi:hypothetical protein